MNDELDNKLSSLKEEHLLSKEHELLRGRIVSFMEANPLASQVSPYTGKALFGMSRRPFVVSAALAVFALSGGVSFAAELALPGDVLYPVKVHVNEGVERVLARTPAAKAVVAQRHIERRALETETLVQEKRMDDVTKETLANETQRSLRSFSEATAALILEGKTEEADEHEQSLDATFKRHRGTFSGLGINNDRRESKQSPRVDALSVSDKKDSERNELNSSTTQSVRRERPQERHSQTVRTTSETETSAPVASSSDERNGDFRANEIRARESSVLPNDARTTASERKNSHRSEDGRHEDESENDE